MTIQKTVNRPIVRNNEEVSAKKTETRPGPLPVITATSNASERINNPTQYNYQYGIKNISLSNSLYGMAGMFITKPIEVEGNIMEVSLSAIDEHPLFNELGGMATDRVTSIEYYVSTVEDPSLNDWSPILSEGTKEVKSEKLFFKGSSATLRFHADISDISQTRVYRNNMVMKESEWYFTERGAAIQLSTTVDEKAVYTIDYLPNKGIVDAWSVKVGSKDSRIVRQVDEFKNGTDGNNTLKLTRYPYVDYTLINRVLDYSPNGDMYRPIEVILKDAEIVNEKGTIQNLFLPEAAGPRDYVTKNQTDYKNNKDAPLKKYSIDPRNTYTAFEYKQEKNKLVFTESFNRSNSYLNEASNHGNATIEVRYEYLVTNFRLKIILRKNTGDDLVVTPTVNSYQLKFKVMK